MGTVESISIEIVGVVIAISRQMCETLEERLLPYYLNILLYLSYKFTNTYKYPTKKNNSFLRNCYFSFSTSKFQV